MMNLPLPLPCSYLFVPGNRPERFDKACAAGAGAVIVDLEDAVPMADKAQARAALAAWLARPAALPVHVRINGADTEWFARDLTLCALPGVAGIIMSKAESVADIDAVLAAGASAVLPLIESAQGFANAPALARAQRVQRLLFGSIDFQLDLGIDGEHEELLYFRSQLVLMSRLAGIAAPVDGVCTAFDDPQQLLLQTMHARRLGFGAKLCIHPRQVAHVNRCFLPSEQEVIWAGRVLAAAESALGAAVAVDGKMIDRPVILKAEKIMRESAARSRPE